MNNIVIPTNYKCELTPFSQRLLQYDLDQSKLFLTRSANFFLNSYTFGYDLDEKPFDGVITSLGPVLQRRYQDRTECILDGFKTSISIDGTLATVKCSPGTCIIDTTMISIFEPIVLTFDILNNYIENGNLLITLAYKWNESILENKPVFKLFMVSNDGIAFLPSSTPWTRLVNELIINKFTFNISNDILDVDTLRNYNPIPTHKSNKEFILIKNMIYEVSPLPNIIFETRNFIFSNIAIKKIFLINDISQWIESDIIPFSITDENDEFLYSKIDIHEINKKDCLVQCYINDMKIETSCVQHVSDSEIRIWMPKWFIQTIPLKEIKVIVIG